MAVPPGMAQPGLSPGSGGAGMHEGTLTFTASTSDTYTYLCPVPGHAQQGMTGTFTVR